MTLHAELADRIIDHYGEQLADTPRQNYDALGLSFANGLRVEIRFATPEEYAIRWSSGGAESRIDTAPLHRGLDTFPNHLHCADGEVRADPYTTPGHPPWDNLKAVLDAILTNPPPD